MKKLSFFAIVFSLVGVMFFSGSSAAGDAGGKEVLKRASTKPIEITAEELIAERAKNRVIFKGNVVARQEGLVIYADELIAQYESDGKEIEKIEANGDVRVVQEGIREATGDRAVFLNKEQRIELEGNATVREGESTLIGEKLTIYLAENKSVIQGGEEGRVRAIINPQKFMKKKGEEKDSEGGRD